MTSASGANWDERLSPGRGNSFDIIRLTLASLVVLEHSFFLIDGRVNRDPLFVLTGGQSNLRCDRGLFLLRRQRLSGHAKLAGRSQFDPLFAPSCGPDRPWLFDGHGLRLLLVSPLASDAVREYFLRQNWVAVVAQTLALKQATVAGAFAHNPLSLVHGTLFTIQYEFDCYLAVALLGITGMLRLWPKATFAALAIALISATVFRDRLPVIDAGWPALLISSPHLWPDLLPFFVCGSAFYVFRAHIPKSVTLFGLSVVALVLSAALGLFYVACLICGTYVVLFLALSTETNVKVGGHKVDLSYGIYLYGWPIQQLLLFYLSAWMTPLILFPSAMVLTGAVAWMSWRFVEAPSLLLVRNKKTERAAIMELEMPGRDSPRLAPSP